MRQQLVAENPRKGTKYGSMGVLRTYLICLIVFHLIFKVYSRCGGDEFTVVDDLGKIKYCIRCSNYTCKPGFGLSRQCGGRVQQSEAQKIVCQPCELGKTYSNTTDYGSCRPCQICPDSHTVVRKCTLTANSECNRDCGKEYYFDETTGSCRKCSFCCDGKNEKKDDCKDMPFYEQCDANLPLKTINDCKPKCKDNQYIVMTKNGSHCEDCKHCPLGTSPSIKCGSMVESTAGIECLGCEAGQTFSDQLDTGSCKTCTKCSIGQKELIPCNVTRDRACGECDKGFYKDHTSNSCMPCSACCNDDQDVHVEKCAEQNMPLRLQCSYTRRAISVCQQKIQENTKQEDSRSLLAVYIAAGVTVGLVTSILIMLLWRWRHQRNKRLSGSHSLTMLLASEEEQEEEATSHSAMKLEDPTVNVSQETLSFEKCGVLLQFNDPHSFFNDAQQIRVEICWDQTSFPALNQDEVQLSPIIKFHPYGVRLSKPVQIRIPHSALVFYTHGWKIKLKSSAFENGINVWKDEEVDEISNNDVCRHVDCLLSYVVVGTPAFNSKPNKKRFKCAIFGGEGKVGENYTAYLYVFDDCEASLEKIMEEEKFNNRILLGSLQSLYIETLQDTDIKISVKQLVEGWKEACINPQVITHKTLKESYKTIPRSEILFGHDDGRNRDFHCTLELTADNTTTKLSAVASIKDDPFRRYRYQESNQGLGHNDLMVTGRNLCDPLITDESRPSICLHELPKEVLQAVAKKLDLSFRGVGNWRHVAVHLGFTEKEIDDFRAELLTPDGSPCTVMLNALQAKQQNFTVAQFVHILQTRKIKRFDVVNILEPYVYELISSFSEE